MFQPSPNNSPIRNNDPMSNTKKSLISDRNGNSPMRNTQKSKNDMIGMFQESYEQPRNNRISAIDNDPIQKELSSAIDAYQKQMRDFKNSLTEMDQKLGNPIISPIDNRNTFTHGMS